MKKNIIVIFILIFIILIGLFIINIKTNKFETNKINDLNQLPQLNENINEKNKVIIKNNKIENEELIDNFINTQKKDEIELNIIDEDKNICIKYVAPTNPQNGENGYDIGDGSMETRKKIFGYYIYSVNGEIHGEFTNIDHKIARKIQNEKVILYFDSPEIDYVEIPTICDYDLDSSNYSQKFKLTYNQRKDLGIKNIFDYGEYKVKTFGGDVLITIDNDMVYKLEDVLNQKIITPDDIINQAKIDVKYGICEEAYYSDGGSTEYRYYQNPQYTILKLNTLNNDKDLIIGMGGSIINLYNKHK